MLFFTGVAVLTGTDSIERKGPIAKAITEKSKCECQGERSAPLLSPLIFTLRLPVVLYARMINKTKLVLHRQLYCKAIKEEA